MNKLSHDRAGKNPLGGGVRRTIRGNETGNQQCGKNGTDGRKLPKGLHLSYTQFSLDDNNSQVIFRGYLTKQV
jgi:hypothetical protein